MNRSSPQSAVSPPAPRAILGWALNSLAYIEGPDHLLRFALCASNLRRQAIFMALSTMSDYDPADLAARFRAHKPDEPWYGDNARDVSHGLVHWRAREIACATWGRVPQGMIGALAKIGSLPLKKSGYKTLYEVLDGSFGPERAAAIRQCSSLGSAVLEVVCRLDPILCRRGVVETINLETSGGINAVVELARLIADASDEAIAASAQAMGEGRKWGAWASRWIGKAKRFPRKPPIADDDEIVGLHSADMMRDAGKRFGNCLRTKISGPALERSYYYEYRPTPAIVELQSLSHGHWLLHKVYGLRNKAVDSDAVAAIWEKLKSQGILATATNSHASRWSDVAKLTNFWDFDPECDFLDFGDDDEAGQTQPDTNVEAQPLIGERPLLSV